MVEIFATTHVAILKTILTTILTNKYKKKLSSWTSWPPEPTEQGATRCDRSRWQRWVVALWLSLSGRYIRDVFTFINDDDDGDGNGDDDDGGRLMGVIIRYIEVILTIVHDDDDGGKL